MQVVTCCIIASFALKATAHSSGEGLMQPKKAGEQSSAAMSAIVRRKSHKQDNDSHLSSKVKTW